MVVFLQHFIEIKKYLVAGAKCDKQQNCYIREDYQFTTFVYDNVFLFVREKKI